MCLGMLLCYSAARMVSKYYQPGPERAGKVADLFAHIAPRYDLVNDFQSFGLHRVWKRRLIRLAAPQPGEHALDVCCGTGDIAFALARHGAQVVGLDFSEPMLAVARRKAKSQSLAPGTEPQRVAPTLHRDGTVLDAPQFIAGDAQQMPFPDNNFDIVTIGYGLRNLANWETGLRELRRVAKPHGRILILDFAKPDNALWRGVYFSYLRWGLPVFGKILCRDAQAYAYIFESLKNYPAQRGVALKMQELECKEVRSVNLLGGIMSITCGRKG